MRRRNTEIPSHSSGLPGLDLLKDTGDSPDCRELPGLHGWLHGDDGVVVGHLQIIVETVLVIVFSRLEILFFGIIFLGQ